MVKRASKLLLFPAAVLLGLFLSSRPVTAKDSMTLFSTKSAPKAQDNSAKGLPEIPDGLNRDKINAIVAGLSDDQVRRLLIQELEKSGKTGGKEAEGEETHGTSKIVRSIEENITLFEKRLEDLRSGAKASPAFLAPMFENPEMTAAPNFILRLLAILVLLAGGLGAEWLFGRYAADMRNRLTTFPPAHRLVKIKRQALLGAIELISILVFSIATLLLFLLFFNYGTRARLVYATFMLSVLIVRGTGLLLRFLLAPETPGLRYLPLADSAPRYIHRWVMRIVVLFSTSFLIRQLMAFQGASEESILLVRATATLLAISFLFYLVIDNRQSVAEFIRHSAGQQSAEASLLRSQLAAFWHLLALPYLVLLGALWMFYLLLDRFDLVVPIVALISSVPLFVMLDALGQRLLSGLFGIVDTQGKVQEECQPEAATDEDAPPEAKDGKAGPGVYDVSRLVPLIRRCLSLSIAGFIIFWVLGLWGFEVRIGEKVAGAALQILLVICLAYVAWRIIEGAINRRLAKMQVGTAIDEDSEGGGKGGSRIGTLLQLMRKFLLVVLVVTVGLIVLAAVGINISPLLAGAGIVGLALGLGSQSLIKDIVSGLFFLIDDAFRIGDYVESGKAKGTVEAISIRSLRLRATRGMVHTVPFSQLGMVTNFSRDYIIVKLDVPVPHTTDIEKVRKVVKKIYKEIQKDEELAPGLLSPIKSAGVMSIGDSALNMRVKFKSKPGFEFLIRRQVLKRLQELFGEQGLEFATRHVMVHLPQSATSENESPGIEPEAKTAHDSKDELLSAAAGAAIAVALAEEEARQKQMAQEAEAES